MKKIIPPLPYKYKRTYSPTRAHYQEWRIPHLSTEKNPNKPRTDQEILEIIQKQNENKNWFTSVYWLEKGLPLEQIDINISKKIITIYNWNHKTPFTDKHLQKAENALLELVTRFPRITQQLRWVLIDNKEIKSAFGDPINYPLNGSAMGGLKAFRLLPRGMEFFPHRLKKVTNFEGTFIHEATHLIRQQFETDWSKKFLWEYCTEYQNDWEIRPTPDGTSKKWFHKKTGEMSPDGQFSLQPDQCVTFYARQNISEDICESMVAYIYDRKCLKHISPHKLKIFQNHNARIKRTTIKSVRISQEKIKLPEIKAKTFYYYILEP